MLLLACYCCFVCQRSFHSEVIKSQASYRDHSHASEKKKSHIKISRRYGALSSCTPRKYAYYQKCDFCSIAVVDNSYDGPHLEDGRVTLEFVQQLLARFKDQKKIHRKYAYTVSERYLCRL